MAGDHPQVTDVGPRLLATPVWVRAHPRLRCWRRAIPLEVNSFLSEAVGRGGLRARELSDRGVLGEQPADEHLPTKSLLEMEYAESYGGEAEQPGADSCRREPEDEPPPSPLRKDSEERREPGSDATAAAVLDVLGVLVVGD